MSKRQEATNSTTIIPQERGEAPSKAPSKAESATMHDIQQSPEEDAGPIIFPSDDDPIDESPATSHPIDESPATSHPIDESPATSHPIDESPATSHPPDITPRVVKTTLNKRISSKRYYQKHSELVNARIAIYRAKDPDGKKKQARQMSSLKYHYKQKPTLQKAMTIYAKRHGIDKASIDVPIAQVLADVDAFVSTGNPRVPMDHNTQIQVSVRPAEAGE
jgi:hypothetical protein